MKEIIVKLGALCAATSFVAGAEAVVLAQWDFNAKSLTPSVGSGSASLVGALSSVYATQTWSTDPNSPGYSWQTYGYAMADEGNKTRGVQFLASTVGRAGIVVEFDQWTGDNASRYSQFQYTIDGANWIDHVVFDSAAIVLAHRTVDLGAIAGAANNANFGFRVVTMFEPGCTRYVAANPSKAYATSGPIRYDMVTVRAEAVPEPFTMLLGTAGLGVAVARSRRAPKQ